MLAVVLRVICSGGYQFPIRHQPRPVPDGLQLTHSFHGKGYCNQLLLRFRRKHLLFQLVLFDERIYEMLAKDQDIVTPLSQGRQQMGSPMRR